MACAIAALCTHVCLLGMACVAVNRRYTEQVFNSAWGDMEQDQWSCEAAMQAPLNTPVLRVLSRNDPIISFEECVDQALFCNLDTVIVQERGGHCDCFAEAGMAGSIASWRSGILSGGPEHGVSRGYF